MNRSVYISTKPYESVFGVEKYFVYPEHVGISFFRNVGSYHQAVRCHISEA